MHQGRLGPDQGPVLALLRPHHCHDVAGRRGANRFAGPDDGGLILMLVRKAGTPAFEFGLLFKGFDHFVPV
jgi:hypothetical protein